MMDEERKRLLDDTYNLMIRASWYDFIPEASKIYVHQDLLGLGTVRDEVVRGPEGSAQLVRMQGEQSKGLDLKILISPFWRHYSPQGDSAILVDEMEVSVTIDGTPTNQYVRATYIFDFDGSIWKNVHFHVSIPVDSENDPWNRQELEQRNAELQRLVDKQTEALMQQNRELEIEASLERVRTRALLMQDSSALNEVVGVLFQQFQALGLLPAEARTYFCHINTETDTAQVWMTHHDGTVMSGSHYTPITQSASMRQYYEDFKRGEPLSIRKYKGEHLQQYMQFLKTLPHVAVDRSYQRMFENPPEQIIMTDANFQHGNIGIMTFSPLADEAVDLLLRFAKVFEFTFTRFLDLQKAEAQAREAQIEAALERVRSRTMGMQRSEELKDVIQVVYDQLVQLDIFVEHTGFIIDIHERDDMLIWLADKNGAPSRISIPYFDSPHWNDFIKAKKTGIRCFPTLLNFEEKNDFYQKLFKHIPDISEEAKAYYFSCKGLAGSTVLVDNIGLYIENFSGIPYSDEENGILMRFGNVFQQTYTRFLDLEKAEFQAREAQIQLAIERVRARTLAMHQSAELSETVYLLFDQFRQLGDHPEQMTIGIFNEAEHVLELFLTMHGQRFDEELKVPLDEPFVIQKFYHGWKAGDDSVLIELSGQDLKAYNTFRSGVSGLVVENDRTRDTRCIVGAFFTRGVISISSEVSFPADTVQVLERFAQAFDLTYTRFLDLQKAEVQKREALIEAALDRLRASSMSMTTSDQLVGVVQKLFEGLDSLGLDPTVSNVSLVDRETGNTDIWAAHRTQQGISTYHVFVPVIDHPFYRGLLDTYFKRIPFAVHELSGEAKRSHSERFFESVDFSEAPAEVQNMNQQLAVTDDPVFVSAATMEYGMLVASKAAPLSEEEAVVLQRFAKVFEQSYTRFRDIKKAEAQAREAQVEAALERVRARTMAMHSSEELLDAAEVLFQQLYSLGEVPDRMSIVILNEEKGVFEFWPTDQRGHQLSNKFDADLTESTTISRIYAALKAGEKHIVIDLQGEVLREWLEFVRIKMELPVDRSGIRNRRVQTCSFFSKGTLMISSHEPISEEMIHVLDRFATAFDQTYTRFRDLKKAEAQAREAKIETSLERVRSKAMAMHSSTDLSETIGVFYSELKKLGIIPRRCGVALIDKESRLAEALTMNTTEAGDSVEVIGKIKLAGHPILEAIFAHWLEQNEYQIVLRGNQIKEYYQVLKPKFTYPDYPHDAVQFGYYFMFSEGHVYAWTENALINQELEIFRRFTTVISLTYKRYKDLQLAEAQAREAEITAALEKVRGKALAMHKSDDLLVTALEIFKVLRDLGIAPIRSGLSVVTDIARKEWDAWSITEGADGQLIPLSARFTSEVHSVSQTIYEHWKAQDPDWEITLSGEALRSFINSMPRDYVPIHALWNKILDDDKSVIFHYFSFPEGVVFAGATHAFSDDEIAIMHRFTRVFAFAYTRYLDLQKSESQAREAIKQSALDRVRAEIASMRSTSDLERVIPVIWNELGALGIPFIRCGVFIIHEDQEGVEAHLSAPDGHTLGSLHLPFNSSEMVVNLVRHWKRNAVYHEHWDQQQFVAWMNSLMGAGQIANALAYQDAETPPESLYLHFVPFTQGMLYVGHQTPLTDAQVSLVHALADAFAVAYARYEDFIQLESAKAGIESTLSELRATQSQLVQAEKMASLGEMTAGIAHEIQNPLNFVNNFSEINKELLHELEEALGKNDTEEIRSIAKDLVGNEEKIHFHGKRADGIVKSMLQHSRGSTGQKEPTDINRLCDEYLRLAFHGLRAKDKLFNAEFHTDLDPTLPKVLVIPQEIGRVLLNMINNAFYAASTRDHTNGASDAKPMVRISTRTLQAAVEIRIEDNGPGIPQEIQDKIFQPFYTTKPTGQGTGLGLSISYDIIRMHGGEVWVESDGAQGTIFVIRLPQK